MPLAATKPWLITLPDLVLISNQAAPSRTAVPVEGTTAASSAVHRLTLPTGPGVTLTGPASRLSSGFSAVSEVMGKPLNMVTDPSPVDGAGTGNAYGSLGRTLLVSVGVPVPLVTEAVLHTVHSPSVLPTGLLLPSARNGTEFTR